MVCLMKLDGSHAKTLENMSSLANEANRAHLEPFRGRSGEFGALSLKMTRDAFFFTCYGVFDVIGWFPGENTGKRELTCNEANRAVLEPFRSRSGEFGALPLKM